MCILVKLLSLYTYDHKRTGLAISTRVERVALKGLKCLKNHCKNTLYNRGGYQTGVRNTTHTAGVSFPKEYGVVCRRINILLLYGAHKGGNWFL